MPTVWPGAPHAAVIGPRLRPSLSLGSSRGFAGCPTSTPSSSLASGTLLILLTATTRAVLAVGIYAASVSALFRVSALYHRVT